MDTQDTAAVAAAAPQPTTTTATATNSVALPTAAETTAQPTRAEQVEAVRRQIEFYLSRENLQTDSFLVSLMDSNQFVSLEVISSFNRLQRLSGGDRSLILEAIEGSTLVQLDETRTKLRSLAVNAARTTLILREVPDGIGEPEIRALLEAGKLTGVQSVRVDIANTWFVTFDSEDDARNAMSFLREQELGGQPIRARFKAESLLRSAPAPPFVNPIEPAEFVPYTYDPNFDPNATFDGAYPPFDGQMYYDPNYRGDYRRSGGRGRKSSAGAGAGGSGGYRRSREDGGERRNRTNSRRREAPYTAAAAVAGSSSSRKPAPVALSPAHFPPLPNKRSEDMKTYAKEEIVAVLNSLPEQIERPESLSAAADTQVIVDTPNRTLASAGAHTSTSEAKTAGGSTSASAAHKQPVRWSSVLAEPVPVTSPTPTSTNIQIAPKPARKNQRSEQRKAKSNAPSSGGGGGGGKKKSNTNTNDNASTPPTVSTTSTATVTATPAESAK